MNIQTDISEKIELHGPLSFKTKNLEEQARGFPQSFSHVTFEQGPWGLNEDCSLVIILVLQKLRCKGTRQRVTILRWHLLAQCSCFWRVFKSSVIISLSKAHFFLHLVLQNQSTYGRDNYGLSCLAHHLFFILWSLSLFKTLAFEVLRLACCRTIIFLWILGFICLCQEDWALTNISWSEVAPAGTAPWDPARMASAVVCCFFSFKSEPLPLLSQVPIVCPQPSSFLRDLGQQYR